LKDEETIVGEVYIGGGETKGMSIIADAAKEMMAEFPNVKIHLSSGTSDYVMEKLDHGLFDFGLVIDPANKQKYESLRIPAKDIWGVLVRHDHFLASKSAISAGDLKGVPLFCSHQTLVENQMSEWLGSSLEHYNFIGSYNLLYNASLMVEAGVGCALCLDGIVNTVDKGIKFIPLKPELSAGLNLIWKKNQLLSRTAKKFLEKLQEVIQSRDS
jgi:DNA-binding transcriptional LysR family regulator